MKEDEKKFTTRAANNADFNPGAEIVSICFEDPTITRLFSALINNHGFQAVVTENLAALEGETRVITEPQYFPALDARYYKSCLVVGNKDALKGIPVNSLSRPLTEDKIKSALTELLTAK